MPGEIQSIYFPASEWYITDAREWIKQHGLKPIKETKEGGNYRFRIKWPIGYRRYVTMNGIRDGKMVHFVIGYR